LSLLLLLLYGGRLAWSIVCSGLTVLGHVVAGGRLRLGIFLGATHEGQCEN
jgi:hypothetical protein